MFHTSANKLIDRYDKLMAFNDISNSIDLSDKNLTKQ